MAMQVKDRGSNLFDVSKIGNREGLSVIYVTGTDSKTSALEITSTGTNVGNGYCGTNKKLSELAPSLKVGETYTLSAVTESTKAYIYCGIGWKFGSPMTITQTMLDNLVVFYGLEDKGAWVCTISNIMINRGNTALPFEPYDNTDRKMKAVIKSRNLIRYPYHDKDKVLNGVEFKMGEDGGISINGTATSTAIVTLDSGITLPPNKTFTLSGNNMTEAGKMSPFIAVYKNGQWYKEYYNGARTPVTFTTEEDCTYSVNMYVSNGATLNETVYPMLNEGTTALPYQPFLLKPFKAIPKSRNLLHLPYLMTANTLGNTVTQNGVTATVKRDGSIRLQGTATSTVYLDLNDIKFSDAALVANYESSWVTDGKVCLSKNDDLPNGISYAFDNTTNKTFICINSGVNVDDVTVYPMVNEGGTPLPYEPPQEYWK